MESYPISVRIERQILAQPGREPSFIHIGRRELIELRRETEIASGKWKPALNGDAESWCGLPLVIWPHQAVEVVYAA